MATPLIEDIAKNVRLVEDANDEEARKNIVAAANELIDKYEKPIDKLARFGWKEPSRMAALRTAFELGLFTTLEDEPMTSAQLAEGTKAEPLLVGMFYNLENCCETERT